MKFQISLEKSVESADAIAHTGISSQITFLAKQNNLQLRQRFWVSCNKSQAKKRGCVDVMSSDRCCKRIIMSGVGAYCRNTVGKKRSRARCFTITNITNSRKKEEENQWTTQ